eukprot:1104056-Prorocentrum_minimum.AAC.5
MITCTHFCTQTTYAVATIAERSDPQSSELEARRIDSAARRIRTERLTLAVRQSTTLDTAHCSHTFAVKPSSFGEVGQQSELGWNRRALDAAVVKIPVLKSAARLRVSVVRIGRVITRISKTHVQMPPTLDTTQCSQTFVVVKPSCRHQWRKGREKIAVAGTNRVRGERICALTSLEARPSSRARWGLQSSGSEG